MKLFNNSKSQAFFPKVHLAFRKKATQVNNQLIASTLNPSRILLLGVFALLLIPIQVLGNCGTPTNLQASVSGNVVTFSWSGTTGSDIHAVLLRNEQTGQNSNGYSSVGNNFATMTVAPGTYVWRVKSLCNTNQRIAEDASEWIWSAPFTMAKTNNYIPQAHAGCEQVDVSGTSTSLSAMTPLDGTGQWTIMSGAGGNFSNPSSATSNFTGTAGTTYILRWTVSNESGSSFHDVLVSFCTPPSQAQAGTDQLNITGTNTTLAATVPQVGSGKWTIVSGIGGGLGDASNASSNFIGTSGSTYVLRWNVSNNCGSTSDDITVSFCTPASHANAGSDQSNIIGTTTTLAAVSPSVGVGSWTIVNGVGGNIANASNASSNFTGIAGITYVLRWTVSNECSSSSDDLILIFCTPPLQANAGIDQLNINSATTFLTATPPQVGSGSWTIVSGVGGGLGNAFDPASTFLGQETTYVLRWTVNTACGSTSDDVKVSFCILPSQANAGIDQIIYNSSTKLSATTPTKGNGSWTIISGTGGNIENTTSASSSFIGSAGTTYVLRWTVSNQCGSNSDDVTIKLSLDVVSDIDGNYYPTTKIGTQTWTTENLKTTKYNDGSPIANVNDNWKFITTGAWTYYAFDSLNNNYGKLYNWYAINTDKICPLGWHVPNETDWNILINYLGGASVAGGKLKSVSGWRPPNTGATNSSGFSALPGGSRGGGNNGTFGGITYNGWWWTSGIDQYLIPVRYLEYNSSNIISTESSNKEGGNYCRCLKY